MTTVAREPGSSFQRPDADLREAVAAGWLLLPEPGGTRRVMMRGDTPGVLAYDRELPEHLRAPLVRTIIAEHEVSAERREAMAHPFRRLAERSVLDAERRAARDRLSPEETVAACRATIETVEATERYVADRDNPDRQWARSPEITEACEAATSAVVKRLHRIAELRGIIEAREAFLWALSFAVPFIPNVLVKGRAHVYGAIGVGLEHTARFDSVATEDSYAAAYELRRHLERGMSAERARYGYDIVHSILFAHEDEWAEASAIKIENEGPDLTEILFSRLAECVKNAEAGHRASPL